MTLHSIDRMAVEEDGDGEHVVCLHGLGGTSNTWTPLMPALAGHRVIRPDLPGSGRSAAAGGALTIAKLFEAVVTICARLNVSRAHFLGHSMGTIVATHLAGDTLRDDLARALLHDGQDSELDTLLAPEAWKSWQDKADALLTAIRNSIEFRRRLNELEQP